jgi:hypothetical protein
MTKSDDAALWRLGKAGVELAEPSVQLRLTDMIRGQITDPVSLLLRKSAHIKFFTEGNPLQSPSMDHLEYTVTELREKVAEARPWPQPMSVRVRGVFTPAVLLNSGWWERPRTTGGAGLQWRDNIQRWTYAGFDEWGPSWDFTSSLNDDAPYLLGQLGEGDEVNSILVVVVREAARRIKRGVDHLLTEGNILAYPALVEGLLCHRDYFDGRDPELAGILDSGLSSDFSYCLLLDSPGHRIMPTGDDPDYYSGYLWQCLWAVDRAPDKTRPSLEHCYIIWEHTDLTKRDVIEYNLDGLRHKAEYLGRDGDRFELLQKSSRLVDGNPRLSYTQFQEFMGGTRSRGQ